VLHGSDINEQLDPLMKPQQGACAQPKLARLVAWESVGGVL